MDETEYESSISSCDEEDERLRPLPPLVPMAPRPVVDVGTRMGPGAAPAAVRSSTADVCPAVSDIDGCYSSSTAADAAAVTGNMVSSNSRSYSNVVSNIFNESTASHASSDQHIATKATAENSPEISTTSFQDFFAAQNVSAVDIDPAVIMYSKPFMKDASCQTVVTGDILSLNFYQGDGCMMDGEWTSFNDLLSLIMRIGNSDLYT